MTELRFQMKRKTWSNEEPKIVEHVLQAESEDQLFAHYFKEFDNRYKYCNDIGFKWEDLEQEKRYRTWLSDIRNYANNGGDMW